MTIKTDSKTPSSPQESGAGATVTPIGSSEVISAAEFAQRCEQIVRRHSGQEMHRQFDILSNLTLRSLGYSEGVDLFIQHAAPMHEPEHLKLAAWLDARADRVCKRSRMAARLYRIIADDLRARLHEG